MEAVFFIEHPETKQWLTDPIIRLKKRLGLWTLDAHEAWQFESKDDAMLRCVILQYKHCKATEHKLIINT